jgi:hypothetical protein
MGNTHFQGEILEVSRGADRFMTQEIIGRHQLLLAA